MRSLPDLASQDLSLLPISFQTQTLRGQRAMFAVQLESRPDHQEEFIEYACVSKDDVVRSVRLRHPPRDEDKPVELIGRLRVIYHKPAVHFGTAFEGYWEYLVVE